MALVFPVLLFSSSWVHERERDRIINWEGSQRKSSKSKNYFAYFPASTHSLLKWCFLLPHATEIKDLPIQRTCDRTNLDDKYVLFGSEQHFGWGYCSLWAMIYNNGRVQICLFVKSKAFSRLRKKNSMEEFSSFDICKNILDLNGLKSELKSVYTTDFAKQA